MTQKKTACMVLNAGSSSMKFCVFSQDDDGKAMHPLISGQIAGIGTQARFQAKDANRQPIASWDWPEAVSGDRAMLVDEMLQWIHRQLPDTEITCTGHRVVHGGKTIDRPLAITPELVDTLEALVPLAPLHQPHNIAPIRILAEKYPAMRQVACFDTAFHNGQPWVTRTMALPKALSEEGIRSYGFHGLSYEFVTQTVIEERPELAKGHLVICHLGNGSSLCAVKNGQSMDTTMSFTALDGVPMGTRCGSIDPGVIFYLMREKSMGLEEVEDLLYRQSGLLGVSGISNDMKVLEDSGQPDALKAIELFCFRVAQEVASLATSMGGLDALVFTGGIGENSALIRRLVSERLSWLGIALDQAFNNMNLGVISANTSAIPVMVVPTNEEMMIARHTVHTLAAEQALVV